MSFIKPSMTSLNFNWIITKHELRRAYKDASFMPAKINILKKALKNLIRTHKFVKIMVMMELLVFYGPPFPLRDHAGNDLLYPETPESSGSFWSPSPSESESSREATPSVSRGGWWAAGPGQRVSS